MLGQRIAIPYHQAGLHRLWNIGSDTTLVADGDR